MSFKYISYNKFTENSEDADMMDKKAAAGIMGKVRFHIVAACSAISMVKDKNSRGRLNRTWPLYFKNEIFSFHNPFLEKGSKTACTAAGNGSAEAPA